MSIKFEAKPIEFEKGNVGIVARSKDKQPTVTDTLISAVRAGQLDEIFSVRLRRPGSFGRRGKLLEARGTCDNRGRRSAFESRQPFSGHSLPRQFN